MTFQRNPPPVAHRPGGKKTASPNSRSECFVHVHCKQPVLMFPPSFFVLVLLSQVPMPHVSPLKGDKTTLQRPHAVLIPPCCLQTALLPSQPRYRLVRTSPLAALFSRSSPTRSPICFQLLVSCPESCRHCYLLSSTTGEVSAFAFSCVV
jgi:hypothetical protein